MAGNEMVTFKGSTLPSKDLGSSFEKALQKAVENIDLGSGLPFLKMDKVGDWVWGQDENEVQEKSEWAINPSMIEKGYVAWRTDGKAGGGAPPRKMRNIREGEIVYSELPEIEPGREWSDNYSFVLQCLNGEDKGTVVIYDTSSRGGTKAWKMTVMAIGHQVREDQTRIVPIVELKSSFYPNTKFGGKTYEPIFEIKRWASYESSEPAQAEASSEPVKTAQDAAPAATNGAGRRRAPVTDVEDQKEVAPAGPAPAPAADPVQRRRRRAAA